MSGKITFANALVRFTALCNLFPKFASKQSRFARTRFPLLGVGYMYLHQVLIGSLNCLRLL